MDSIIWVGIFVCLCHSAMFSGLNLAFFSLSRLRLEAEASAGNRVALKVLELRRDSNFLLTTILWGNVGINVLLTLLSNSVMIGVVAFCFSTIVITFAGEIIPQAYFSRNAMKMASLLSPVMRCYQYLLYPVAKPSAIMLDKWLGQESIVYMKERQLKGVIAQHTRLRSFAVIRLGCERYLLSIIVHGDRSFVGIRFRGVVRYVSLVFVSGFTTFG